MNIDGDTDDELNQQPVRKKRKPAFCKHPFCGKKGHTTTRSMKCLANPERLACEGLEAECAAAGAAVATTAERSGEIPSADNNNDTTDAANDLDDNYKALPLDEGDLFYDAGTWSKDEEGDVSAGKI